jgi:hypothetical protein
MKEYSKLAFSENPLMTADMSILAGPLALMWDDVRRIENRADPAAIIKTMRMAFVFMGSPLIALDWYLFIT